MAEVFGDANLFAEFDKDRETQDSFICGGHSGLGTIVLSLESNDSSAESEESDCEKSTVTECLDAEEEREKANEKTNDNAASSVVKDILSRGQDFGDVHVSSDYKSSETSFKILHERNKYARYAKIIDSTRYVADEVSPCVQILFQNNSFSRKYRTQIEHFIADLAEREVLEAAAAQHTMPDLQLQSGNLTCVDLNPNLQVKLRTNQMWTAHAIIGCAQFHNIFMIDSRGWPLINYNPSLTDGWELPVYEQPYEDPLPVDEEDLSRPNKKASRPKPSCFNCGGDHMMSDCKEPKDYNRIKNNRRDFMDKNSPSTVQKKMSLSSNKGQDNKFMKFKPGFISAELREAMGLEVSQLPIYIYRMRLLGYPPGWLKEAETDSSPLVMFDKDGREVNLRGESLEDGEVDQEEEGVDEAPEVKIDTRKIIEYPGFTMPVPKNMVDEWEQLNMPPLQPHQLKNTLEEIVETTNTVKKRKMEEEEEEKVKRFKMENPEVEMELSDEGDDGDNIVMNGDFVPPLPVHTPPAKPPLPDDTPPVTPISRFSRNSSATTEVTPPPVPDESPPMAPPLPEETPPSTPRLNRAGSLIRENSSACSTPRSASPSLETLEQQYKVLVQQLGGESVTTESCSGDDPESSMAVTSEVGEESSQDEITSTDKTMSRSSSTVSMEAMDSPASLRSQDLEILRMNTTFKAKESISKEYSTPVIPRPNSVSLLPDASKFGVGIEDHIPFENLPDSTGTFEKMRGLISLIRNKVSTRKKKKN